MCQFVDQSLHIFPYFMYASSKGTFETAEFPRLSFEHSWSNWLSTCGAVKAAPILCMGGQMLINKRLTYWCLQHPGCQLSLRLTMNESANQIFVGQRGSDEALQSCALLRALVCFFDLILYVPSTIFQLCRDGSSWVEQSYSRTHRSDAGEARTRGPSVSSQALYHWAPIRA